MEAFARAHGHQRSPQEDVFAGELVVDAERRISSARRGGGAAAVGVTRIGEELAGDEGGQTALVTGAGEDSEALEVPAAAAR